jgi:hypothetical protein
MSETTVVRYRTKPQSADENQRLIEAVMAALAVEQPDRLQYAAYRLADGVTFVHVVAGDGGGLTSLPAFQEFQRELSARVDVPPERWTMTLVGAYGPASLPYLERRP